MKKCKFIGLALLIILFVSCVTSQEDDKYGYNYGVDDKKDISTSNDDENKPPSTIVRVQNFLSGDTFVMVNGKILKLAGIESPKAGEPYFKKAKDYAQWLIGTNILRLVWIKDTKKIDKVWKANVIISKSGNMISVNEQMVKRGLAKVTVIEPIKYQTIDLKDDAKLISLSDSDNKAVFDMLIEMQKDAHRNKLNIWSGKYEE
ncbi:MAG: thermonuclease family protein [Planctomycetes bacterium]|nr:thermonuclease family protein [Planctomycetota bacterium]